MYAISLEKPILLVWAGVFLSEQGVPWKHKPHVHSEEFELILATKGAFTLQINEQELIIKEGSCTLIPPLATVFGTKETSEEIEFYWLHFLASWEEINEELLKEDLEQIAKQKLASRFINASVLPTQFTLQNKQQMELLVKQLLTANASYSYSNRGTDFLASGLLTALSDDYLNQLAKKVNHTSAKTAYVAEWIRVHLYKELTITEIAEQFEMNANYLTRLFRKEQGVSLKEYILQAKLTHAKYLLTTTIDSIEEVAEHSFFGDSKHFMRIFKNKVGVTPTAYRKTYSTTHLNTQAVDPSSPLPNQFGEDALKKMIKELLND
ncbi:hypothetical protein IGI37_002658 [Enterococcus sp. AZ194]|uniref:AraC family transcriptional regulator n=1 Tax=Enterococcus sp. AZ194 TaxID=2774629 RepID=UPI003F280BC2